VRNVAIPLDMNVTQKEAEKKVRYKNSSIEIQKMWNMKCFAILVIIGATGIVTGKKKKKEKNNTRKVFNRFSIINSCTRDNTHKESAAI
jgi:hypothetical protein